MIQISATDHSYWFNDNFGTQFRCSGKPHQRNPIILMPGSRISIEFKATSQGGRRKTSHHGDELYDRYGYKIAVNPIYSETTLNIASMLSQNSKKLKISKSKIKEVINWLSLLNSIVHASSIMSQTLIKGSENEKKDNPIMTLSLLKGGFSTGTLDDPSNPLAEFVEQLKTEEGIAHDV